MTRLGQVIHAGQPCPAFKGVQRPQYAFYIDGILGVGGPGGNALLQGFAQLVSFFGKDCQQIRVGIVG